VILVDANLLLYAVAREAPEHAAARVWLDERLSGSARVGLPWPSLLAFVRLIASPRVVERPLALSEAWRRVTAWLAQPPAWVPLPTSRHADLLGELLERERAPRLVPDAHLAALAIEHGLRLCSTDGDFARFPTLAWENPLAG
jgi:toxin-antitoxin system PIN domain toxin